MKALPRGRIVLQLGGRVVTPCFALMHRTVLLVLMSGVVLSAMTRVDGACSSQLGTLLRCLGPLLGGAGVLLMAVHSAICEQATDRGRAR